MLVTEVRVKAINQSNERLLAYCDITLDSAFVIRDLRLIKGDDGYIVAMPSRKAAVQCSACSTKNNFDARYCNNCGQSINTKSLPPMDKTRQHYDVAHPINAECRRMIEEAVVNAFKTRDQQASA